MKDPLLAPLAGSGRPWRGPWTVRTALLAALLVAGLTVQLAPLVAFPTVLSQDGPAHVAGAWALVHRGDDGSVGEVLREQYRVDLSPVPNMLATLLLTGLLQVVGPDAAERLLVAGIVAGLVAALAYAARGVSRRAGWLGAAGLLYGSSHLLSYGFYNFALGVIGSLLVLGVALRRRSGWSPRGVLALTVVSLLTWTAHLLPWVVGTGGALLLAVTRATADVRGGTPVLPAVRRHVLPPGLAVAPGGVLTAAYLATGDGPPATPEGEPSLERVGTLLRGERPFLTGWGVDGVPDLGRTAALLGTAALVVLALLALRRTRADQDGSRADRGALGVLLAGALLAVCLTPERLGPDFGFLVGRLAWFPPLFLALWAATRPPGRVLAAVLAAVLVVSASAGALARWPAQAAAAAEVDELLSVSGAIAPGSTLVVLQYSRSAVAPEHGTPDPLRHESSRLAVRSGSVDLGHYEAVEAYFQVEFPEGSLRGRLDPEQGGLERIPPAVDLPAVRGDLDYVVVLGLDRAAPEVRGSERTRAVLAELAAHYRPVATSVPTGSVTVWRAVGSAAGDGRPSGVEGTG
ncbi:hypothetical protein [Geodermatophilus sp. SYSU D01105]